MGLSSDSESGEETRKKKKKKHKDREKSRKKKKKKRESENDDSDDDGKEREKRKKKRREGSEEEERLRQIALNSLISEHSREERSSTEKAKEEVVCEDIGEDVEAEVNHLAAEVDSLTAETDVTKPTELSHEEEVKKRSDQLLDDLFIYMSRERKRMDEEETQSS